METIYVLESIAPPQLHVDRFLPPTPIRVLVDHYGSDASGIRPENLQNGEADALLEEPALRDELIPALMEKAQAIADSRVGEIVAQARKEMAVQLDHEVERLEELRKVNRSVRPEEIEMLVQQRTALDEHLKNARLRLDAIRLIQP